MGEFQFAVVNNDQAKLNPYPYVYIEVDGSYRELLAAEKVYLQEKFHPNDGNRPYVKSRYWQLTPDAKLSGFLFRKKLLRGLKEGKAPKQKKYWDFWRR